MKGKRHGNFRYLLAILILLFVAGPWLQQFGATGAHIINALLVGALLLSIRSLGPNKLSRISLRVLSLGIFGLTLTNDTSLFGQALYIAFFLVVMGHILKEVLTNDRLDIDHVLGAITVYLLAGVIFGLLFMVMDQVDPTSFTGNHSLENPSLMYFSLVTLSTLGYGDIVPVTPLARNLAALEALFGQVYLGVFVASLVTSQQSQRDADSRPPDTSS